MCWFLVSVGSGNVNPVHEKIIQSVINVNINTLNILTDFHNLF